MRRSADQQNAVHLIPAEARLPQHLLRREAGAGKQVPRQVLEIGPRYGRHHHLAGVRCK